MSVSGLRQQTSLVVVCSDLAEYAAEPEPVA